MFTVNSETDYLVGKLSESLDNILNFDTWDTGDDVSESYKRLEKLAAEAVEQEERVGAEIRRRILPLIANRSNAPPGAGLYRAKVTELEWMHRNLLFNGATVAADGSVTSHDSLLFTAAQIGVCMVNYAGDSQQIRKQLFRRDVRIDQLDPVDEMVELLEARQQRSALGYLSEDDEINQLLQRGLMAYAERAALLERVPGKWLVGHGNPIPLELLSASIPAMFERSIKVLRQLVLEHKKFVYVPSAPRDLMMATLGNALLPLQFLIVDTVENELNRWVAGRNYSPVQATEIRRFINEVGPKVVRGVYRASPHSPACMFYAHVENAQAGALLAMADSVLQAHRGFPLLIDLADALCRVHFDGYSFRTLVQQSYAKAGQPFRYLTERETRR